MWIAFKIISQYKNYYVLITTCFIWTCLSLFWDKSVYRGRIPRLKWKFDFAMLNMLFEFIFMMLMPLYILMYVVITITYLVIVSKSFNIKYSLYLHLIIFGYVACKTVSMIINIMHPILLISGLKIMVTFQGNYKWLGEND